MVRWFSGGAALGAIVVAACGGGVIETPAPSGPGEGGFYSQAQADRGGEEFRRTCGECHSVRDFRGRNFEWDWRRQTAWNLFTRMRETMPEDFPGLLSDQRYADIIAFILRANDYAPGTEDLSPTQDALAAIALGPGAPKTKPRGGTR